MTFWEYLAFDECSFCREENKMKFTKEEQKLCEDILGHVNIDVEEMMVFKSMREKIESCCYR